MKIYADQLTKIISDTPVEKIINVYYEKPNGKIGIALQFKNWLDSKILLIGGYGENVMCFNFQDCYTLEDLNRRIQEAIIKYMEQHEIEFFISE